MEQTKKLIYLLRKNLKIFLLSNIFISFGFILFTPMIFSISMVDTISAARIIEQYSILVGVILFVPIIMPEEKYNILEIIESRKTRIETIYIVRILLAIVATIIFMGFINGILSYFGGNFSFYRFWYGGTVTAIFIGTLGMFMAIISGQTVVGYIVSIGYFILDMMTKGKYTGKFTLFSLANGDILMKNYLLLGSMLLIMASIGVVLIKRKIR